MCAISQIYSFLKSMYSLCTLQVLVLPFDRLQLVKGFFIGVFEFKELCAETAGLFLRAFQLGLRLLKLLPPLRQHLDIIIIIIIKIGGSRK